MSPLNPELPAHIPRALPQPRDLDQRFLGLACHVSGFIDTSTKVSAVAIHDRRRILATSYTAYLST